MYISKVSKGEDSPKRMVWAEVYAPDRPDSGGDFATAEEIEKMAYAFMKKMALDAVDELHQNTKLDGVTVVESFIARKGDPDFIEGSWVVGMHIDNDEMWEKIEKGEINGFSLEAMAKGEDVEVEIELPPVVSGKTSKSEDHTHTFYVSYDEEGRFLGGRTDDVNGHRHLIKRGTVTEEAKGHTHRFSSVDDIKIIQ